MSNYAERMPAQAIEAEMAVLGAMIIEKNAILKTLDILDSNDFYKDVHKKIFEVIKLLFLENIDADIITVSNKLIADTQFIDVGGVSYLASLIDSVQTAANVEHYAKIVQEKSIVRSSCTIGMYMIQELDKNEESPLGIIEKAQSLLCDISVNRATGDFRHVSTSIRPILRTIETLAEGKSVKLGIDTGYTLLDKMTGGLQKGNLIILAARPSMGKTALALNIAEHSAGTLNKPTAIFSLEMSEEELLYRFLSNVSQINGMRLRNGKINIDTEAKRLNTACSKISTMPLYIQDSAGLTIFEIQTKAKKLAAELKSKGTPLELIMVDYIQIMRGSANASRQTREREIAEISLGLKKLAKDLKIPVVALSQLSRETEKRTDKKPILSDLRESGAIEQDADVVMFLHREGYYKREDPDLKHKATLIIAKQRNGAVGEIELKFTPELTKFENNEFGENK